MQEPPRRFKGERCMRIPLIFPALLVGILLAPLRADEPKSDPPAKARPVAPVVADIDKAIRAQLQQEKIPASPAADDAEFLRRAYLDLTGRIPTAEQAVKFLDSKEPDRRQKLLEELLASENYGRHFGVIWSDLIVKRDDGNRGLATA